MRKFNRIFAAVLALGAGQAMAQASVYDGATGVVTIPSVSVGAATFVNVTLRNRGDFVFDLLGATEQKPAGPGVATYDAVSGMLTMPAVKVGDATFLDVKLLNTGNFVFTLQAATEWTRASNDEVKAFLARADALWASAVPANGAQLTSFSDACYRHNGYTKAYLITDFDRDLTKNRARDTFQIGMRRANVQVTAVRNLLNPDGSARREIDLIYDIEFTDGSTNTHNPQTVISGSSAGTPGCTTPEVSAGLRFYGNQRLVDARVRPRNQRDERYSAATGAALNPAVRYRRDVRVQIQDPMANAKYVTVTGLGPTRVVNGEVQPFAWKMVSPFVMRSAPEFAGKPGNFVDWEDDDSFRYCGVADSDVPLAQLADCATYGAPGDSWGVNAATADAAADATFAAQGWAAGGVYRIDVYNDDGWKTVNGQAGRTPIATYYETLERLPYTFVEMAGSGTAPTTNDRFPRLSFAPLSIAGVRTNSLAASPNSMSAAWNEQPPLPDGRVFRLTSLWEYFEGLKVALPAGSAWPKLRSVEYQYPGSKATSFIWPVKPKEADATGKSYIEYMIFYTDRNNAVVQSRISFN